MWGLLRHAGTGEEENFNIHTVAVIAHNTGRYVRIFVLFLFVVAAERKYPPPRVMEGRLILADGWCRSQSVVGWLQGGMAGPCRGETVCGGWKAAEPQAAKESPRCLVLPFHILSRLLALWMRSLLE